MSQWTLFSSRVSQYLRNRIQQHSLLRPTGPKRLLFLFLASILVSLWLVNNSVTAEMLFQSPQSPAPAQQPPAQEPPAQEPPPQQPPAEQPPAQPAGEQQPSSEQPPAAEQPPPAEQPDGEQPSGFQSPVEQPPAEPPPAEEPPLPAEASNPEVAPAEEPAGEPVGPITVQEDDPFLIEEEGDSRNFILDQVEFIDTIVVSGAYIWLCCGVFALLLIPLFMLILYIRGRRKIVREDEF